MHHRRVPVHRDAHKEEDAPVQADVFEDEGYLAERRSSRPAVQGPGPPVVEVDSHGERDDKTTVCGRQAEQVDGGAVHDAAGRTQPKQSQAVGGQPQQEDDAVGHLVVGEAVACVHRAVGEKRLIGSIPQLHVSKGCAAAKCCESQRRSLSHIWRKLKLKGHGTGDGPRSAIKPAETCKNVYEINVRQFMECKFAENKPLGLTQ